MVLIELHDILDGRDPTDMRALEKNCSAFGDLVG